MASRHGVQVLNYVLEPFPWLLMTVYELFNEQQALFVEKNPQEDKLEGGKQSWLSKTAQGQTTSASDLSSTEGDGPARKAKVGPSDKTTSGDDSMGEKTKGKPVKARQPRKSNKKEDQQTKDAKTIQMLKDTVNRVKRDASAKDEEINRNKEEINTLTQLVATFHAGDPNPQPESVAISDQATTPTLEPPKDVEPESEPATQP
jgi:hypothetical protein